METKQTDMTPKEKAEELVDKMYFSRRYDDAESYIPQRAYDHAKECALIAVDEILDIVSVIYDCDAQVLYPYWEDVKKEIENIKGGEQ